MSESAKFDIALFSFVCLMAFLIGSFASIPPLVESTSLVAAPYCATPYTWPALTARAAYVKDLTTQKILYEKNSEVQLPLASLTKLMTVYVALDSLMPQDFMEIPSGALTPEGDAGLYAREIWNIGDLVDFTLMTSANDGAHALALASGAKRGLSEGGFIFSMNEIAKQINMTQTYFVNDTGLDVASSTPGALGSARDVVTLLNVIFNKKLDIFTGSTVPVRMFVSQSNFKHAATNTTAIGGLAPEAIISKTGYTDLAGGNLALLFEPFLGHPVAAVVLGSTLEGREEDMKLIVSAITADLRRQLLCEYGS